MVRLVRAALTADWRLRLIGVGLVVNAGLVLVEIGLLVARR